MSDPTHDLRQLLVTGGSGALGVTLILAAARIGLWVVGKVVKLIFFVVFLTLGIAGLVAAWIIHLAAQHPGGMDAVMAGQVEKVVRLAFGW